MRLIIMLGMLLGATAAASEEGSWTTMSGTQITEALTGHSLQYDNARQEFRASGRTLYNSGRDSWGYWAVRGAQYCSLWPPQDLWACYKMERRGDSLRFVGPSGDITEGLIVD